MATRVVLFTLAVVLLLAAGELPVPVSGEEPARLDPTSEQQQRSEGAMPVPVAGGTSAGDVEEDSKAYIVGRPLIKVPPSSPCRAKAIRC
ncbi:hypothetical protein SETIT_6G197800v2 [Setaria italica]|uniref:Uncharacterized protein n=1 Tax=Setaria italica TaxID=4555 RepID=A0A368RNI6_SETIT|nr:hypothetical protein SETIT_6G197800v2 [Setaria italica]